MKTIMTEGIALSPETELEVALVNAVNHAVRVGISSEALAEACCALVVQLNSYLPMWREDVATSNGNMTLIVERLRAIVDGHDRKHA